jgi:hypothetical protein
MIPHWYMGAPPVISPNCIFNSLGIEIANSQAVADYGVASVAWPAANRAIYIPVVLHVPMTIDRLALYQGGTLGSNFDVGVYEAVSKAKLVSTGSTAQGGSPNILTIVTVTTTFLARGLYFLAVALNGTGQTFRFRPAQGFLTGVGVREQATAFPLPATASFAVMSAGYLPMCAMFRKGEQP